MRRYYFAIAATVVVLDQASTWLVVHRLTSDSVISVIPDLFNIVYTRNPGVAFGMLSDSSSALKTAALVAFSALVIGLVTVALWTERHPRFLLSGLALSLILGGAIGNVIDRMRSGSVVDFLDFYWKGHHWHTFNTADSAIVVGAILWTLSLWSPHTAPRETDRRS